MTQIIIIALLMFALSFALIYISVEVTEKRPFVTSFVITAISFTIIAMVATVLYVSMHFIGVHG